MISSMRKAAAVLQSATTASGHSHLNMAIYHEKCVAQVMTKLTDAKAQACKALLEWANHEENPMMEGLYQKLSEIDQLWLYLHQQYATQYNNNRRSYKPILRGEKQLDDLRKHCESQQSKLAKVRKQTENMSKSSKKPDKKSEGQIQRLETQQLELCKAISLEEKAMADFKKAKENHALFKYAKVQEALFHMHQASRTFYESCLLLEDARKILFQVFLSSSITNYTAEAASRARASADDIIRNLANDLSLPHPQFLAEKGSFQMQQFNLLHAMSMQSSNNTLTKGPESSPEGAYMNTAYKTTDDGKEKPVHFVPQGKLDKDLINDGENTYMPLPQKEIQDVRYFRQFPSPSTVATNKDDGSSSSDYEYTEPFQYSPPRALKGGRKGVRARRRADAPPAPVPRPAGHDAGLHFPAPGRGSQPPRDGPDSVSPSPEPEPKSLSRSSAHPPDNRSPAPLPDNRSPAPPPDNRSPAPPPDNRSPAPLPDNRAPAPLPDNPSPAPPPDNRSPGPPPDNRSPAPPTDNRSPGPPPDDRAPAPSPDNRAPAPLPDDRSPAPLPDDRSPAPPPDDRSPTPPPGTLSPPEPTSHCSPAPEPGNRSTVPESASRSPALGSGSQPPAPRVGSRSPGVIVLMKSRSTSEESCDDECDYLNMTKQKNYRPCRGNDYDVPEKVLKPPPSMYSNKERRPPPIPEDLPAPPLPARSVSLDQTQTSPGTVRLEHRPVSLTTLTHSYTVASSSPRLSRRSATPEEGDPPGPPALPVRIVGTPSQASETDDVPKDPPPKPPVTEARKAERPIPAVRKHVKQLVRQKALPPVPTEELYHGAVPAPNTPITLQDTGPQDYMTMDQIANLPSLPSPTEPSKPKS